MPGLQISTPYYAYDFSLPVADKNIGVHHSTAKFMIVICNQRNLFLIP